MAMLTYIERECGSSKEERFGPYGVVMVGSVEPQLLLEIQARHD